jgi:hypothetical protein
MKDEEKINQVKDIIQKNFKNRKFTTGDIYYSIEKNYDKSKFGTIRNIIVSLSKEKYLDYIIEVRGSPHYDSEDKKKGASYSLLKH